MTQGDKQAPQSTEETGRDIRRVARRHLSAAEKLQLRVRFDRPGIVRMTAARRRRADMPTVSI